ncbi:DUF4115 domain-containing protein [Rickettsiales bacterium]|nr:DUF4115 domain-containing protein [Rickettsiales bacterium]
MQEVIEKNENVHVNEVIKMIGKRISSARKESKQKIDKISRKLKIRTDFLLAIEEGSIENLPEEVYLKGFIKSYANYFNINIDQEMLMISSNYNEVENQKLKEKIKEGQTQSLPTARVFSIVFLILLLVIFSWDEYKKDVFYSLSEDDRKGFVEESQIIATEKIKSLDTVNIDNSSKILKILEDEIVDDSDQKSKDIISENTNGPLKEQFSDEKMLEKKINSEIRILFHDTTWFQIKKMDGSIIESGIFEKEETINVAFDEKNLDYFIDTGNAGGFKLLSNNKEFPLLGELGSVRKNVSLLEYFNKYINIE